jgi:hypothetical protein
MLTIKDGARLEMLVNTPPMRLFEAGEINLPKAKRIRTPGEEREAIERAVSEARRALFSKAMNAPHAAQRKDPIGRAWYEGLLDGSSADPAVLREIGREYGNLYWGELRTLNATIAGYYARVGRPNVKRKFHMAGLSGKEADRFASFERALEPLGHHVRHCVQKLCVNDAWFLQGPDWLDRCINERRAERIRKGENCEPPYGPLATRADTRILAHAIAGLKAIALGISR